MKIEFVRNPYNYDSDALSEETGLKCLDESLTEQQFVEESDINYIAEKFMRTGMAAQVVNMPTFGDFEGIFDFQSAMNIITQANQEFMALPAKIRTRFDNDPQQLLAFLDDENNREEAIRLGLIPKPDIISEQSNNTETFNGTESRNRSTSQNQQESFTRSRGTEGTTDKDAATQKSRSKDTEGDR